MTSFKHKLNNQYIAYFNLAYYLDIERLTFVQIYCIDPKTNIRDDIHMVMSTGTHYIDAYGCHDDLFDTLTDKSYQSNAGINIEILTYDQIIKYILKHQDIFNDELLIQIRLYVRKNYTKGCI